jgi:hypothetical protein
VGEEEEEEIVAALGVLKMLSMVLPREEVEEGVIGGVDRAPKGASSVSSM